MLLTNIMQDKKLWNNLIKKSALLFLVLFLLPAITTASITVTKEAPSKINFGDILTVTITIENTKNSEISLQVKETISGADPVNPAEFETYDVPEGMIAWAPPYYEWNNITLAPKDIYVITYQIKPITFGDFFISPTIITTYPSEEIFYSNHISVLVSPLSNGICEPEKGENSLTNPEDCPLSSKDGICDLIKDGICDPDCTPGSDPDCTVCGDGKCDLNETQENCCMDCGCPSGERCLNNICTEVEICGNEVCGIGENSKTCVKDCPSGGDDDYCDKIKDGICDPNCERSADSDCICNRDKICEPEYENYLNCHEDCEKPASSFMLIIILTLIVASILIYFIYAKSKKIHERNY